MPDPDSPRPRMRMLGLLACLAIALLASAVAGCDSEPREAKPPVAASAKQPGPTDAGWLCSRHDAQHTSRVAVSGPTSPTVRWRVAGASEPEPAVGPDGTLYIPDGEGAGLLALRSADGKKVRTLATEASFVPAIASDGRVVVSEVRNLALGAAGVASVAAFDVHGKKLWRTNVGRASDYYSTGICDPVVGADGVAYVGTSEGNVVALSPDKGKVKWKRKVGGRVASVALMPNGTVVASSEGGIFALGPDGTVLWKAEIDAQMAGPVVPVIGLDGTVYVGESEALRAIGPDGKERWRVPADGPNAPAIGADGTLYSSCMDGVIAVSPQGKTLWNTKNAVYAGPVIDSSGHLYVHRGDGVVLAYRADGTLLWQRHIGSPTEAGLTLGPDGTLFVCTGGDLCALADPATAEK